MAENECPLAVAVRNLVCGWYPTEEVELHPFSRGELSAAEKNKSPKSGAISRGAKRKYPKIKSACAFARCLAEKAQMQAVDCGAIYFEDMDFGASVDRNDFYRQLIRAVYDGFEDAGFKYGVPMIPKPRSEAWMLCIVDKNASRKFYYENLPGKDKDPDSGKKALAEKLGCAVKDNYSMLQPVLETYDWQNLKAPSFVFFKNRLSAVSAELLHKPFQDEWRLDNTKEPS